MAPSSDVKHVRGFNGALHTIEGHGIVGLQEEAKQVLIPDVLYVPNVQANLLGKLARHTFPDKGSDAEDALAVVYIDLCGPFRVAAKDGSLYFLLLKDRHTQYVWVKTVAKKSDVLRAAGGGAADEEDGSDAPLRPWREQNGMAEREICMGVQHLWWHLALRQAVLVRNCLEGSTTPPGTTPCQLLLGKKPDLTMARVWGCMVQFMVPEQQRGGKLAPKAHWGIHLGVLLERKGWEVFDLTDRKIVTTVEAILYETLSLEVWTVKYGPALGQMEAHPPTDTLMVTLSLLAEVDEPADEAIEEVPPSPPPPVPASPPLVVEPSAPTPPSATGEWSKEEVKASFKEQFHAAGQRFHRNG
ncbi:unnamed protein product [Closterium sp. NIES-53]